MLLQISDDNKPKNCTAEFTALQKAYNKIVDDYTNIPNKLKNEGVERVEFGFEETDIGSTNLTDSKSMCAFAQTLVTLVKNTGSFHKKRLEAARYLVCTKAGGMLKSKLTSKFVNCLIKTKRIANQGNDTTAKTDIQNDIDKFNKNGLKRVSKLFLMMKDKCLMKDTEKSRAARVVGVFKSKLTVHIINKKAGSGLNQTEMDEIANAIIAAVLVQHPHATNIVTKFKTAEGTRRQLRPRRALESNVEAETTYDLDTPGPIDEEFAIVLEGDFSVQATEVQLEPTAATIEVTKEIQYDPKVVLCNRKTGSDTSTTTCGEPITTSAASNLVGEYFLSLKYPRIFSYRKYFSYYFAIKK